MYFRDKERVVAGEGVGDKRVIAICFFFFKAEGANSNKDGANYIRQIE